MNINKQAGVDQGTALDQTELGLINAMSRKKLTEEEVYTFAVRLCDNEVDRDGERFPAETLEELAPSLWVRAVFSTTSGAPPDRPPASTAPNWCGMRASSRRRGTLCVT